MIFFNKGKKKLQDTACFFSQFNIKMQLWNIRAIFKIELEKSEAKKKSGPFNRDETKIA